MSSVRIKYDDLLQISAEMFMGMGYSQKQASTTAKCLVEADARHLHSHGVAAMKTYAGHIKAGSLLLDAADPTVVFETDNSLVMEGHAGVGYVIAKEAVERTIEKAKTSGICITTVRNANHYGFAGGWAEMMANEGLIGITSTNTVRCVCPTRSAERNLGTNPISVAFPVAGDERMFLLDMATTVMAHGKLCRSQVFAESGIVPDEVVIDSNGNTVTDFKEVLDILAKGDDRSRDPKPNAGGLLPLGGSTEIQSGHKGYGLALLVELLTAGLSQGVPSKFIPLASQGICFFFMAIDPALFGLTKEVLKHVAYIVQEYRKTVPIDPALPVLIPGDKEKDARDKAMAEGVELSPEIVAQLREVAVLTGKEKELEAVFAKSR